MAKTGEGSRRRFPAKQWGIFHNKMKRYGGFQPEKRGGTEMAMGKTREKQVQRRRHGLWQDVLAHWQLYVILLLPLVLVAVFN